MRWHGTWLSASRASAAATPPRILGEIDPKEAFGGDRPLVTPISPLIAVETGGTHQYLSCAF
jgi:hypothetical protein